MKWHSRLAGLLAALLMANASDACVRKVRWTLQAPYGVVLPSGERAGYYTDVATEALARVGCRAELVELPWARSLRELEDGRIDLLPGMLENAQRRRYALFSQRVNLSPNLLFLSAEAARRVSLARLDDVRDTDLRIAVERGAYYSSAYAQLLLDPRFVERLHLVPDRERAWRMLASGRVDGVISDQASALVAGMPRQPGENDPRPALVLASVPARIAFSRRTTDEQFVRRFNAALTSMIEDGSLIRLRERYIPCKTDPDTLGCRVEAISAP